MRYAIILVSLLAFGCAGRQAADANARGMKCLNARPTGVPSSGNLVEQVLSDYKPGELPQSSTCAAKEFARAVSLAPSVPDYRINLARALSRGRAYAQAQTELREAVRLDPSNMEARRLLARLDLFMQDATAEAVVEQLASR